MGEAIERDESGQGPNRSGGWGARLRAWRRRLAVATGRVSAREQRFRTTYEDGVWCPGGGQRWDSGPGALPENATPWAEVVDEYVRSHSVRRVLDIGCGDFRASGLLRLPEDVEYTGVDIVAPLIERNRLEHVAPRRTFIHADALTDPLPPADLCLLKHVLQHWSNRDILAFLPRLDAYRHVLILDGRWASAGSPPPDHGDIETGPDFRKTGLHLERPPFHCRVETLLRYESMDGEEVLRLVRYLGRDTGRVDG